MKTKLTVTMDDKLIPQAKRYAREHNRSLSSVIEESLAKLTSGQPDRFSERWQGRISISGKDDPRFEQLSKKYL
ncbi:DUF6364 family protein [Pontiella desulfatans]|nr:DUF6364 family protein [Pontiella desulfatans]